MMLLFSGFAAMGISPLSGDLSALVASCSEYTYLTKGKRIDGTMYSCSSFGTKVGAGIGTAVSGWLRRVLLKMPLCSLHPHWI